MSSVRLCVSRFARYALVWQVTYRWKVGRKFDNLVKLKLSEMTAKDSKTHILPITRDRVCSSWSRRVRRQSYASKAEPPIEKNSDVVRNRGSALDVQDFLHTRRDHDEHNLSSVTGKVRLNASRNTSGPASPSLMPTSKGSRRLCLPILF